MKTDSAGRSARRKGYLVARLDDALREDVPMVSASVPAGVVRIKLDQSADSDAALRVVEATATACGAWMFIDAAEPEVKARRDVFGPPRDDLAIMRRIKGEYDPGRILSPGRFYGRL